MSKDLEIICELAKNYAEAAFSDVCLERENKYRKQNSLKIVRPIVLVFEEPWGEYSNSDELKLHCQDAGLRNVEWNLRAELFKWNHYQGDYILPPFFGVGYALSSTDTGPKLKENVIHSDTGSSIMSHIYDDVLPDDEAVDAIKLPVITHNIESSARNLQWAEEIFKGILPVKHVGVSLYFASWDQIPRFHGVENTLCDLYDRPEFAHKLIEKYTRINEVTLDQYEALNVLEPHPYYLHCTPALTDELPQKDFDGVHVRAKDIWCRAMAQIFGAVSPAMHNEFDFQYTKRFFDRCGLAYYGCCEPLDNKIDMLRKFKNLRRISITPWANVDRAAEAIHGDYVFSYKANPAYVASENFDPQPVQKEIKHVLEVCKRTNTPCEIILKDISTVKNRPENLSKWMQTVNNVIDSNF